LNKEECIKIIKFHLIYRQVVLNQYLRDENNKEIWQRDLNDIDEALKYLGDNLK
jgi:hypothetical protein